MALSLACLLQLLGGHIQHVCGVSSEVMSDYESIFNTTSTGIAFEDYVSL